MNLHLRNFQSFEPSQMINQAQLWLAFDRPKNQGATLGLQDGERRAIPVTLLVTDMLGHHDLPFFRHMHDCHSRKLLREGFTSNSKLSHVS